jgi:hypothetical protein
LSPPGLLQRLQTLRKLPVRARVDLVRAQVAIARALLRVRFSRKGQLLLPGSDKLSGAALHEPAPAELARARELAVAVRRMADHGPLRAACLARALATCSLLEQQGLRGATVRVGVRMREAQFLAHAWVEYRGVKLLESESEVANLREVDELTVRLGA